MAIVFGALIGISFAFAVSLGKLTAKIDKILSEIREFKKEMECCNRAFDRSLTYLEKKIESLQELVGEDNA